MQKSTKFFSSYIMNFYEVFLHFLFFCVCHVVIKK